MTISTFDIIVIAVYLIGITAFGIWIGFRRHASTDHYFRLFRDFRVIFHWPG